MPASQRPPAGRSAEPPIEERAAPTEPLRRRRAPLPRPVPVAPTRLPAGGYEGSGEGRRASGAAAAGPHQAPPLREEATRPRRLRGAGSADVDPGSFAAASGDGASVAAREQPQPRTGRSRRPVPLDEPAGRRGVAPPRPPSTRAATPAAPSAGRGRPVVDAPVEDAVVLEGPLVSPGSVAGRALTVVVAIMTFLSSLLVGGAILVHRAADAWGTAVMDEVSVTVMPLDGEPVEERLRRVAAMLAQTDGLAAVEVLAPAASEALLRPWLGEDVDLSLLPVPRLVTAERTGPVQEAALDERLSQIPGVSLDDHRGWSERLSAMAAAVAGGALAALGLMLVATVICVVFATRSTIAANAGTVEVLHVLGAEDRFVAGAFRRRFLRIGVRGAGVGLGAALLLFGALDAWARLSPAAASPQSRALFGEPSIGAAGYGLLLAVAVAVALLVAMTSALSVRHHLDQLAP